MVVAVQTLKENVDKVIKLTILLSIRFGEDEWGSEQKTITKIEVKTLLDM